MAETEYFEKTPKKAARWFRAFIILTLLFGITFSLNWFFNWLLFFAASYSLFMSYFLLPVQPKIFQGRPNRGPQKTVDDVTKRKRTIFVIIGIFFFVMIFIPFLIGMIEGLSEETPDAGTPVEETVTEELSPVVKGNEFFTQQQYDSADKYYDMALAEDPGDMEAVYGKGIVAYNRGNVDVANTHFIRAYDGGFRYAWLSWALADMYDKQNMTGRAVELYKESVNLDSTYTDSYLRLAELEPSRDEMWRDLAEKHK